VFQKSGQKRIKSKSGAIIRSFRCIRTNSLATRKHFSQSVGIVLTPGRPRARMALARIYFCRFAVFSPRFLLYSRLLANWL